MSAPLSDDDYHQLLGLRTDIRGFLQWSQRAAKAAGLTSQQHQLMLAVRGHPDRRGPTIGDIAEYFFARHHSMVELADRCETAGLVRRRVDDDDKRVIRLELTDQGLSKLEQLSAQHLDELKNRAPHLLARMGITPPQDD